MVYANKLDRVGADFDRCVEMVRDRLAAAPLVFVQRPVFEGPEFIGVVDLIQEQAYLWRL